MRWTGAIGQVPQENAGYGGKDEFSAFREFRRCSLPTFEGEYGPDKAQAWMREIEKIFFEGEYGPDIAQKEVRFLELKRERGQYRGKPYDNKKKQKFGFGGKPSGGGTSASIKCYKCGKPGHKVVDCGVSLVRTCYSYGEQGHINAMCDKPKKEQEKGKVFALSGDEATAKDRLIREYLGGDFGIDLVRFPLD
ncbi:uncharacterized protein LOC131613149 [Vicia villosa]|uniref:uncharacterized protein LOC131613149 n=1 Tax=Vicia villosa TaxID=3911 RepID=UPI00273B32E3|nr:uncharacterized protein LOC131613149 [Vicia villosa]